MTRFALTSVLATVGTLVSCFGSTTSAQNTNAPAPPQQETQGTNVNAARQQPSYDWSYRQQTRVEDPRQAAVRRRAEFRAQQREMRLAAQQWYGVSNSRPTVTATPWWSSYRPVPFYRSWQRYAWFSQTAPQPTRSTTVETTIETTADGATAGNKLVR